MNRSQSSNDAIPSAIHVSSASALTDALLPALARLREVITARAGELEAVVKTGRTHLMDAMPLTLGQELGAWAAQIQASETRLRETLMRVHMLPLGGTAVGTGVNAPAGFAERVVAALAQETGLPFTVAPNRFALIAAQDTAAELSGQLNVAATALVKIANDLRWMNSGPLAGLGEIELPAVQPGSSIMPGKVNPVIPESVAMACAQVTGNHVTVTVAAQAGNFQLNTMLPVIGYNLLQSIGLLAHSARNLADRAILGMRVRHDRLADALNRNPILVTALATRIGYDEAASIAKQAYREGRTILEVAAVRTGLELQELRTLLDPRRLTGEGH